MSGVSVKVDHSVLDKKLADAEPKLRANIARSMNRIGTMAVSDLRKNMPRDTSYMAINTTASQATQTTLEVIVTSKANYTTMQDKGTKPFWPNTQKLIESGWAMRHNPKVDRKGNELSNEAFAFLVGRAISKKGIKAKHFINPSVSTASAEFNILMRNVFNGVF